MNVLFLDMDGVINHRPTRAQLDSYKGHWSKEFENEIIGIHPPLVEHLRQILDFSGAVLVSSSSWRYFEDHPTVGNDWRETLAEMLRRDKSIFIGNTPVLGDSKDRRGKEIKKWIEDNNFTGKYCVIDDNVDDIVNIIPENLVVETDSAIGLTHELALSAIDILK